ncbi:hypothetical protein HQ590_08700, partial [bacterium]|nr:hypothetical protein [bacterium]
MRIRSILSAVVLTCLLAATGYAADIVWTNELGGAYGTAGNWDPNGSAPPVAGDAATLGLGAGTNYTVTFSGNQSSDFLQVTNGNVVTLDLAGNTYDVDNGGSEVYVGSNATDNVTLVINNGTLDAEGAAGTSQVAPNGSTASMVLSNGGKFTYNVLGIGANGTVLVTDPGSQLWGGGGSIGMGGLLIVSNGATAYLANQTQGSTTNIYTGVGTVVTNYAGSVRAIGSANGLYMLLDGATHDIIGGNQLELGVFSGTGQKIIIGDAGPNTSTLTAPQIMFGTTFDAGRGAPEMIINAGGIVRAGSTPMTVNGTNVAAWVYDQGTLTMNGGIMRIRTNTALYLANLNVNANRGLLRGSGTISALAGTDTFTVYNDGNIRPGDTNATARIGTLNLVQGNLVQGNGAGVLHLDFDPLTAGSADLLSITGGNATITAGSNIFNNITGASTIGFGTWDFLRA